MMMRKKRLRLLQSGKSTQPLISKKCLRKKAYKGILESAQISMEDVKVTFEVVASSFFGMYLSRIYTKTLKDPMRERSL